jgi:adenylate cyclase
LRGFEPTRSRQPEFRSSCRPQGEVIVDRNDIYGEGVNIAARLESLADPGGICISESVKAAVAEQLPFAYEFLGEQLVKNIAAPIRVYRMLLKETESKAKSQAGSSFRPSIAVLPFENLSGDPEREYFVSNNKTSCID